MLNVVKQVISSLLVASGNLEMHFKNKTYILLFNCIIVYFASCLHRLCCLNHNLKNNKSVTSCLLQVANCMRAWLCNQSCGCVTKVLAEKN